MFLLVIGYIRGKSSPVPARRRFSGWTRVYPREFFSCTHAAMFFRLGAGISAGNLLLYPRGATFRSAAGISARFSLLYPRGGVFPAGCGYIRAVFSPVPARPWHKPSVGTHVPLAYAFRRHALAWLHAQRLLKSVSDGLSTGVCKQPRMAYVCGLSGRTRVVHFRAFNGRDPGGTLSRAVFFSYYTTLFFL